MLASAPIVVRGRRGASRRRSRSVDGPFFDMFRLPLLRGDPRARAAPVRQLVLSETEAMRIFGGEDSVGRT